MAPPPAFGLCLKMRRGREAGVAVAAGGGCVMVDACAAVHTEWRTRTKRTKRALVRMNFMLRFEVVDRDYE